MKIITLEPDFPCSKLGDEEVTLTIKLNNQLIVSTVLLGIKPILSGDISDNFKIGKASKLIGKKLIIFSNVTDWREDTDIIEISYILKCGSFEQITKQNNTVKDKETIEYRVYYDFT